MMKPTANWRVSATIAAGAVSVKKSRHKSTQAPPFISVVPSKLDNDFRHYHHHHRHHTNGQRETELASEIAAASSSSNSSLVRRRGRERERERRLTSRRTNCHHLQLQFKWQLVTQFITIFATVLLVCSLLSCQGGFVEGKIHHSKRQAINPTTTGRENTNWWNVWWQQYIDEAVQPTIRPIVGVSFDGRSIHLASEDSAAAELSASANTGSQLAVTMSESGADSMPNTSSLELERNGKLQLVASSSPAAVASSSFVSSSASSEPTRVQQQQQQQRSKSAQQQSNWQSVRPTIIRTASSPQQQQSSPMSTVRSGDSRTGRHAALFEQQMNAVEELAAAMEEPQSTQLGIQMRTNVMGNARQAQQQQQQRSFEPPPNSLTSLSGGLRMNPSSMFVQQQQMPMEFEQQQQNQMVDYAEEGEPELEAGPNSAVGDQQFGAPQQPTKMLPQPQSPLFSGDSSSSSMMMEPQPQPQLGSTKQTQRSQPSKPMILIPGKQPQQPTTAAARSMQTQRIPTSQPTTPKPVFMNDTINGDASPSTGAGAGQTITSTSSSVTTTSSPTVGSLSSTIPTTTVSTTKSASDIDVNETPISLAGGPSEQPQQPALTKTTPTRGGASAGRVELENGRPASGMTKIQGTTTSARLPTGRTTTTTTKAQPTTTTRPTQTTPTSTAAAAGGSSSPVDSTATISMTTTTTATATATAASAANTSPTSIVSQSSSSPTTGVSSMAPTMTTNIQQTSTTTTTSAPTMTRKPMMTGSEMRAQQPTTGSATKDTTMLPETGDQAGGEGDSDSDSATGTDSDDDSDQSDDQAMGGNNSPPSGGSDSSDDSSSDDSSDDSDQDADQEPRTTTRRPNTTTTGAVTMASGGQTTVSPAFTTDIERLPKSSSQPATTATKASERLVTSAMPSFSSVASSTTTTTPTATTPTPTPTPTPTTETETTPALEQDIARIKPSGSPAATTQSQANDFSMMISLDQGKTSATATTISGDTPITMPMETLMKLMMNQMTSTAPGSQQQFFSNEQTTPIIVGTSTTQTTSAPTITTTPIGSTQTASNMMTTTAAPISTTTLPTSNMGFSTGASVASSEATTVLPPAQATGSFSQSMMTTFRVPDVDKSGKLQTQAQSSTASEPTSSTRKKLQPPPATTTTTRAPGSAPSQQQQQQQQQMFVMSQAGVGGESMPPTTMMVTPAFDMSQPTTQQGQQQSRQPIAATTKARQQQQLEQQSMTSLPMMTTTTSGSNEGGSKTNSFMIPTTSGATSEDGEPKIELLNLDLMPIQKFMSQNDNNINKLPQATSTASKTNEKTKGLDKFNVIPNQTFPMSPASSKVGQLKQKQQQQQQQQQQQNVDTMFMNVEPGMRLRPVMNGPQQQQQQQQPMMIMNGEMPGTSRAPLAPSSGSVNNQANTVYMIMMNNLPTSFSPDNEREITQNTRKPVTVIEMMPEPPNQQLQQQQRSRPTTVAVGTKQRQQPQQSNVATVTGAFGKPMTPTKSGMQFISTTSTTRAFDTTSSGRNNAPTTTTITSGQGPAMATFMQTRSQSARISQQPQQTTQTFVPSTSTAGPKLTMENAIEMEQTFVAMPGNKQNKMRKLEFNQAQDGFAPSKQSTAATASPAATTTAAPTTTTTTATAPSANDSNNANDQSIISTTTTTTSSPAERFSMAKSADNMIALVRGTQSATGTQTTMMPLSSSSSSPDQVFGFTVNQTAPLNGTNQGLAMFPSGAKTQSSASLEKIQQQQQQQRQSTLAPALRRPLEPKQQQQVSTKSTAGGKTNPGKANSKSNLSASFIPPKLRSDFDASNNKFSRLQQPQQSNDKSMAPQKGTQVDSGNGASGGQSAIAATTLAPLAQNMAIRQFGGANRMSVLANQPVPFGRPAAMTMQKSGNSAGTRNVVANQLQQQQQQQQARLTRIEVPTFEYGPSIAVRRPDEPLANGQMPNCTLTGKNFCVLTKDYPMNEVRQAVERSFRSVRIMYEELQTVSDQELHKDILNTTNNQAASGKFACQTQVEMMRPGWAKDEITKEWMLVVNTDVFPQRVRTESCAQPNTPCEFIAPFYDSTCQQRYSLHRMIAIDPHDPSRSPQVAMFRFPAGCVCRVHPIKKTSLQQTMTMIQSTTTTMTTPVPQALSTQPTSQSLGRKRR